MKLTIKETELISGLKSDNQDCYWIVVTFNEINETVGFTLNDDFTVYLKNPDGSALDDSESDFDEKYGDEPWYKTLLDEIENEALKLRELEK